MARLIWDDTSGFDYRNINFSLILDGVDAYGSWSRYDVYYADGTRDAFRGYDFTYDWEGVPTGGTITSYTNFDGGYRVALLDNVRIPVQSVVSAAFTPSLADDRAVIRNALSGNDTIRGGYWDDILQGFAGNDKLTGSIGADDLYGGKGADTFVYTRGLDSFGDFPYSTDSMDFIFDFSRKQRDKVDFRKVDANETIGGNQAFRWIGTAEFTGNAGELRYEKWATGALVQGDMNGDGIDDVAVFLKGVMKMNKGDFFL